jgi:hypothetical protein
MYRGYGAARVEASARDGDKRWGCAVTPKNRGALRASVKNNKVRVSVESRSGRTQGARVGTNIQRFSFLQYAFIALAGPFCELVLFRFRPLFSDIRCAIFDGRPIVQNWTSERFSF